MSQTPADPEARRAAFADLASGTIFVALAAGLAVAHFAQGGRLHADFGAEPGPALLPRILLLVLGVAGALLILRSMIVLRRSREGWHALRRETARLRGSDKDDLVQVLLALALLALFQPVRGVIGAAAALCLLGAALAMLTARGEARSGLRARARPAIEGALIALVLFALFRFVLGVPLR